MARGRDMQLWRNGSDSFPSGQFIISKGPKLRRANFKTISTKTVLASKGELGDCVIQIRAAWAREAQNVLALADLIWRIRISLQRSWSALWRTKEMPFSKRTAEKYVAVGEAFDGLSANDRSHLPAALNTLYCLSELGREKIEELIREGHIHPGLKLREAQALVAECDPDGRRMALPSKIQTRLNRFARFVRREMRIWSPRERETVAAELANLVGEIRAATDETAAGHKAMQEVQARTLGTGE